MKKGQALLNDSLRNKGTAFSQQERKELGLLGLLPDIEETLDQQVFRAYKQYKQVKKSVDKYQFLRTLQDQNETIFYRMVQTHLLEMLPIIYTPTVGEACQTFSAHYRQPRGLFISYPDREEINTILQQQSDDIRVIVVTDGSRILGLGDQGVGGMGIPIGKLALYTVCGGINPAHCLPIMLDVGTNNPSLLKDRNYVGWRQKRLNQNDYDRFLDNFIQAVKRRWPTVLLQFEDFSQHNAMPLLTRYRDELCCFNDDIQGTAAVTVGALLAACKTKGENLSDQVVAFAGAGSAGCGIAEQIIAQMCTEGLTPEQARSRVFMVDRDGLLTQNMTDLHDFQKALAQPLDNIEKWQYRGKHPGLLAVIREAKPNILIGVSGQKGLFTQRLIKVMAEQNEQPIIFPLSNPSSKVEATPSQLIRWSKGRALIATGSPFKAVSYDGQTFHIPQCNNSYIFPGIGLGVITADITRVTDDMLTIASNILASSSPLATTGEGALLPPLTEISEVSRRIAFAIGKIAQATGETTENKTDMRLSAEIKNHFWKPKY